MSKMKNSSPGRPKAVRILAMGFFISCTSIASAQQSGMAPMVTGQSISTQAAVEYATIGGTALSIPILSLDRPVAGRGTGGTGQVATNQQVGNRNTSVIDQSGIGNNAAIRVTGDDNRASILQSGRNNLGQGVLTGTEIQFDLRQRGIGNQADVAVNSGNTQSGTDVLVQQIGNNNSVTGSVPGGANVVVNQVGNGATADVSQAGVPKSINVLQFRAR